MINFGTENLLKEKCFNNLLLRFIIILHKQLEQIVKTFFG